ncbi:hypothetical protein vB_PsyM_KIL3b_0023 [Pseudomonas phage vB_PsyM_KIL3b]|uniref:Uncharacterized protein n=4 Tax=Pseudomonas phage vB_PsyM_KIL1 TaxID=1777065 RepID=A0A142IDY0_9CAUD|nr:hypothetical protein BH774_gp023 [Pseudomonas phage vB_PsyM_KIL1]AMR57275.1 hypothetical protein vB_PsyM_KIL1_0023 [Pseudomonas phage vB_PsyM_KIL1]AMR57435.1 hypothetical protein vB_PsyM_KIL2_0024 [Pseudomonas phage vB_PsyM_KIL2]AMR57595.1 hypothetical protein vB_PsyM_KIL3_0023 [Pseudomonas phage vB_PsyM_KIL3]AMR58093.1 hypothetical protein vB_PsyM_KIL3b_0023 [Pseudomonas phage vB_PsyM_KIL3b]
MSLFRSDVWVGRRFQCGETGVIVTLTEDMVRPRAFIGVGNGAIDLGDGYCSRRVGDVKELKEGDE